MTNMILSIGELDYAIIHTGYEDRFLDQTVDDSGKMIRPIDELFTDLNEVCPTCVYIDIYEGIDQDVDLPFALFAQENIPVQIKQMANQLPLSGVVFKISNIGDVFNLSTILSNIANKYELMNGCDLAFIYRMKYIENNDINIMSVYFDTESG